MMAQAEERYQDQQHRGLKNLESVKKWREKSFKEEKLEKEQAVTDVDKFPGLRWTQD